VDSSRSEQQRDADDLLPGESGEHAGSAAPGWDARVQFLFLSGVGLRAALAVTLILCALYVLDLLAAWGVGAWLVLSATTACLAWVLLDDAFDVEGSLARETALAATFEDDRFGARGTAVRAYSDAFVRVHGAAPHGAARLRQPGSDLAFRAHFPSRHESRGRYAKVLLISLERALRVVAAGLVAVIAAQLYVVLAG
jgi:hypothetical protein